jgi:hypothetical protein
VSVGEPRWRSHEAGEKTRAPDVHSAEAILAHPAFRDALAVYFERFDRLYRYNPFLNKLVTEATRSLVFFTLLVLDAGYDVSDRTTWPTLANVHRAMTALSLGSARHIDHLIQRLAQVGFIETQPSTVDRRVRLLRPAKPMIDHDLDWIATHYAPLAHLFGADRYRLPINRDRAFQVVQRRVASAALEQLSSPLVHNPIILFFTQHDSAFLILVGLIRSALKAGSDVAVVPYAELARRYAISRTHIRRLLDEASERGWLAMEGRHRRAITLLPPLWDAIERFVAEGMANHDLTCALAMSEILSSTAPP